MYAIRSYYVAVHGKFFANSGASIVQELGFALAEGAEYLTALTEAVITSYSIHYTKLYERCSFPFEINS